jgi:hypothetical protein
MLGPVCLTAPIEANLIEQGVLERTWRKDWQL